MAITTRTLLTSGPTVLIVPTSRQHRVRSILILEVSVYLIGQLTEYLLSIPQHTQYAYCYDHTFTRVECPTSSSMAWGITGFMVAFAGLLLLQRAFYEVIMCAIEWAEEWRAGRIEVEGREKGEGEEGEAEM